MVSRYASKSRGDLCQKILIALIRSMQWLKTLYSISDKLQERNYIFDIVRNIFELHGFQPLETPAMENIETLLGKYGEEGDRLIFRILESGDSFTKDFFEALGKYLKEKYELINYYKNNVAGFENTENPFSNPLWEFNPEVLDFISGGIMTDDFRRKNKEIKLENLPALKS